MRIVSRSGTRWTQEEDDQLAHWWTHLSAKKIGELIGRSEQAVINRGRVLGLGSPRGEYLSLSELERTSGYAQSTIKLAAQRLGITLRRQPVYQKAWRPKKGGRRKHNYGRNYAIPREQADAVLAELARVPDGKRRQLTYRGEWGGPKPDKCLGCGTSERPHCAKGLCARCYRKRGKIDYKPMEKQ